MRIPRPPDGTDDGFFQRPDSRRYDSDLWVVDRMARSSPNSRCLVLIVFFYPLSVNTTPPFSGIANATRL
jgi:hypothetical protein